MIYFQINAPLTKAVGARSINQEIIERAAQQTLIHAGTHVDAEITVVITDDEQMQALNQQFRGIDDTTDVLAFPAGEIDPDSKSTYLGDVIISYFRALTQAEAGTHTLEDELQLLTVHGVLHLLGHDHAEQAEKSLMWEAQAEILAALGCSVKLPQITSP
jgi:probable rRNA maturation factor